MWKLSKLLVGMYEERDYLNKNVVKDELKCTHYLIMDQIMKLKQFRQKRYYLKCISEILKRVSKKLQEL